MCSRCLVLSVSPERIIYYKSIKLAQEKNLKANYPLSCTSFIAFYVPSRCRFTLIWSWRGLSLISPLFLLPVREVIMITLRAIMGGLRLERETLLETKLNAALCGCCAQTYLHSTDRSGKLSKLGLFKGGSLAQWKGYRSEELDLSVFFLTQDLITPQSLLPYPITPFPFLLSPFLHLTFPVSAFEVVPLVFCSS